MSLKCEVIFRYMGVMIYTQRGQDHRKDGPAVMWESGDRIYYLYNKIHRINGPALYIGHVCTYYINDEIYSKEEYESKIRSFNNTGCS